jgi:hypothetical protein
MRNIGYYVSKGELNCFNSDGKRLVKSPFEDRYLNFFIYGNAVKPKENKSPLSICRDMISTIGVTVIPVFEREKVRGIIESDALSYIKPKNDETVVVVRYALFDDIDKNIDALKALSKSFYDMISTEVKSQFGFNQDIIVYWDYTDLGIGVTEEDGILILRG